MFNTTQANEAPYLAAGGNALQQLMTGVSNGTFSTPLSIAQYQQSPGYQFQMQQGNDAVLNNASRLGGVNSGNTLKALTSFGQGLANQDYQQAYANYAQNQNQAFGQLETLAGAGQNAAASLGGFGSNTAANIGNNLISAGNASAGGITGAANAGAAGQVAQANALSGGINSATSGLSQNYLLYSLLNGGQYGAYNGGNVSVTPGVDLSSFGYGG